MKLHHITQEATNSRSLVDIWNESLTCKLTMAVKEVIDLEQRFFIDVDSTIPDELMGKLLHHFRDQGMLLNKEDLSRV